MFLLFRTQLCALLLFLAVPGFFVSLLFVDGDIGAAVTAVGFTTKSSPSCENCGRGFVPWTKFENGAPMEDIESGSQIRVAE